MNIRPDLLMAAVAFTIQAAIDMDGEVTDERVQDLRQLEQRLMTKVRELSKSQLSILTHDLLYAIGHLHIKGGG